MITYADLGDHALATASSPVTSTYLLLDQGTKTEAELGYLFQGKTFTPYNWKEVWNSQIIGMVNIGNVSVGKPINPSFPVDMKDGVEYSAGFLRASNGYRCVLPGVLGLWARVYHNSSAAGLVKLCYHEDRYYQSKGVTYCETSVWHCDATLRRTGSKPNFRYYVSSASGNGWKLNGYSESTVEALVAAVASGRQPTTTRTVTTVMSGKQSNYRWIPMEQADRSVTRAQVESLLRHNQSLLISAMRTVEQEQTPRLHARSFDQLEKFNGNFLVFLSKLDGFGTVTLQSLRDLGLSSFSRKDIASFWLANRYGDRLSMSTFASLVKAIDKEFLTIRTKTERFLRTQSRMTIPYSDGLFNAKVQLGTNLAVTPRDYNALMKFIRTAYEWDFYPTLANVWDAIPLSFVVDWIGNVGDIFASVDRMVQARYYDVACILQSARIEAPDPFFPDVTHIYYERRIERTLRLGVEAPSLGLPSFINLIDGLALLCG